jgi:hypothetical protein
MKVVAFALLTVLLFACAASAEVAPPPAGPPGPPAPPAPAGPPAPLADLPKELLEKGKKATALVILGPKEFWTAFCVDSSGLFLTIFVDEPPSPVQLVLNPGEANQRMIAAEVVSFNGESHMALLKATENADFTALELVKDVAADKGLPLHVFGFESSDDLKAKPDQKFPAYAVSNVTVGEVLTSGTKVMSIQWMGLVGAGAVGGPVLDDEGKLYGMVAVPPGIGGGKPNRAETANSIRDFLAQPVISLRPVAKVTADSLAKPVKLRAFLVDFQGRDMSKAVVEVSVEPSGGQAVAVQMKGEGGKFSGEVQLALGANKAAGFQAKVRFADSEMTGILQPVVFKCDGEEISLDKVSEIKGGDAPTIILRENNKEKKIDPAVKLTLKVGPLNNDVDLAKVKTITILPPPGLPPYMTYRVVVKLDDKEISREEGAIAVDDVFDAVTPANEKGAEALEGIKSIKCPSEVFNIIDAAGGKLLICHFPKIRRLGVFDVGKLAFVKFIPLEETWVSFAAGRDKLVIACPEKKTLERWDLKTLTKDKTVPFEEPVSFLAMGSDADNPLYIAVRADKGKGKLLQMDVSAMKVTDDSVEMSVGPSKFYRHGITSADGSIACPGGLVFFHTQSGKMGGFQGPPFGGQKWKRPAPHCRGEYVYCGWEIGFICSKTAGGAKVFGGSENSIQTSFSAPAVQQVFVPSRHDDYYLGLTFNGVAPGSTIPASLYIIGETRALGAIPELTLDTACFEPQREDFPICERVWFLPRSTLIITLPYGNRLLVAHKFDPVAMHDKSGIKTPALLTPPPRRAKAGEPFTYQFKVRSRAGGVKYTLDKGPDGMKLSDDGILDWAPPAELAGQRIAVVVVITDNSGESLRCEISLWLPPPPKDEGKNPANPPGPAEPPPAPAPAPPPAPAPEPAPVPEPPPGVRD